ncbi:MAG: dTDP-4-dehydrorhamnose 3,5-epimerase [Desulfobacula sp.]|nr:dTDP-4-dehydrorhamnose 3,5-epimerase [Desulfobacula sp.]
MKFIGTDLKGAFIIEHGIVEDNRGRFSRLICTKELKTIGHTEKFVQINHSHTKEPGSVRGMHFQAPPAAEIKIVKCIKGAVFDVIVDIRRNSPTFLCWYGQEITEVNMKMMYIPKGFAHGFQTLNPDSELIYFHTEFYSQENEGALHYMDPRFSIKWPLSVSDISERDTSHPFIDEIFEGIDI